MVERDCMLKLLNYLKKTLVSITKNVKGRV